MKRKLLDLYCGAGGAAMGYAIAAGDGFEITGVDIKPQPRYPFRFIQGDALEYLRLHGHEFDIIHASPPLLYMVILAGPANAVTQPLELMQGVRRWVLTG